MKYWIAKIILSLLDAMRPEFPKRRQHPFGKYAPNNDIQG